MPTELLKQTVAHFENAAGPKAKGVSPKSQVTAFHSSRCLSAKDQRNYSYRRGQLK